jgi:hypothetical protein
MNPPTPLNICRKFTRAAGLSIRSGCEQRHSRSLTKAPVIGHVSEDGTFAERLERTLSRSDVKVIEHRAAEGDE